MIDQTPGETYFAQVPDISARAAEVGSKFLSYSTGIEHTQVARNKSLPPEEWTGAAADAASEEIKTLGEKATELAQAFPKAKTELDEWPTAVSDARSTIDSIRQQWDSAISTYNSAIRNANKLAGNDPDKKILTDAAYQTAEAEQTRLKDEYTTCINNLDDSAQTVADKLLEVRRGYVSDQAVSRGRGAVAAEIFTYDTMPIVGGAANWQYAQEAAPALLRDLEAAADGSLSADLIQQLQDTWGERLKNPFFVQAMADLYHTKHPGAGDFSDMLNRLALKTSIFETNGIKLDESEKALRNQWLQTLGTTMVLSTGGFNAGDYAGVEVSESFATVKNALVGRDGATTIAELERKNIDSFIATGNKDYAWHSNFFAGGHGTGFDITTQVMGFAAANNPNLAFGQAVYEGGDNSLASKIVQYDHDWPTGVGRRSTNIAPTRFPLAYDIPGYESAVQQSKDPLQTLFSLSDTPDWIQQKDFRAASHDPLMLAEQNRLEAVRDFMNKPTPFTVNGDWDHDEKHSRTDETIPMIRYLTGSSNPGPGFETKFADEGDALGKMVEDLTQPLDEHTEALLGQDRAQAAGKAQAMVAGNFIAGYQDGLDQTDISTAAGEDRYGSFNPKLRPHAGAVMANWIESFVDQNDSPWDAQTAKESVRDGVPSVSTGRPRFVLSKNLFDAVFAPKGGILTDLAFDQSALDRVNSSAYGLYKRDVALAMSESNDAATFNRQSVDAINRWGPLLAHIDAAPAGMEALQHDEVVRRNQAARNAIDVLASVVPFDMIPGNRASTALTSLAVDGAKDSLLESYYPTDFSSQDLRARLNASYATSETLQDSLAEGFLSRSDWPNAEGKTKEEIIDYILEKEVGATDPDGNPNAIVRDENGSLPPYTSLTKDQRRRLRGYLSTNTELEAALNAAGDTPLSAFMKDGFRIELK